MAKFRDRASATNEFTKEIDGRILKILISILCSSAAQAQFVTKRIES